MTKAIEAQFRDLLEIISAWPVQDRLEFAREVLGTLGNGNNRPRRNTLERALGLARGSGPPPDDAEVERILDEHRTEKYLR